MKLINLLKNPYHLLLKKVDTINESVKESNSKNNKETIVTPSILLRDTFNSLSEAHNSLKLNQDKDGNMSILGVSLSLLVVIKYKYTIISMNLLLKYTKLYHIHHTQVNL